MQNPYNVEKLDLFYQTEADDNFHIFLKKEPYLLEIPHYHESLEFAYIEREETVARIRDQKQTLTVGDICFVDKFQIHSYDYYRKNLSAIVIVLGKEYTVNLTRRYENMTFPSFMTDKEKNKPAIKVLNDWLNAKDKTYLLNCSYANLFFDALIKAYPLHRRETLYANEKAIGFIDYINEHFAEQISLQSMAKNFGYSEGRCSYLFNTCVGVPFKTYLNQIRMQKAVELLSEKTLSVSEIMEKCGFNSSVTFYRQYRKFKETVSRSEKTE